MMHKLVVLLLFLSVSELSFGGVETELYSGSAGDCLIKVMHSAAVGDNSGTILFSSFKKIDGIHFSCEISAAHVSASLENGLTSFKAMGNLVPINSIRIGHIRYYKWIQLALQEKSKLNNHVRLTYKEFNRFVEVQILSPFIEPLIKHNFNFMRADCEKRIYYDNGAPKDAFCWLIVE